MYLDVKYTFHVTRGLMESQVYSLSHDVYYKFFFSNRLDCCLISSFIGIMDDDGFFGFDSTLPVNCYILLILVDDPFPIQLKLFLYVF